MYHVGFTQRQVPIANQATPQFTVVDNHLAIILCLVQLAATFVVGNKDAFVAKVVDEKLFQSVVRDKQQDDVLGHIHDGQNGAGVKEAEETVLGAGVPHYGA